MSMGSVIGYIFFIIIFIKESESHFEVNFIFLVKFLCSPHWRAQAPQYGTMSTTPQMSNDFQFLKASIDSHTSESSILKVKVGFDHNWYQARASASDTISLGMKPGP